MRRPESVTEGAACDLLRGYGTLNEIMKPDDTEHIRAGILRAYRRRHEPHPGVDPNFARLFNRPALTSRLAAVFDAVVDGRSPRDAFPS